MMDLPIGQDHTEQVRREERMAALWVVHERQLTAARQLVGWEAGMAAGHEMHLMAARQPEQIRSNGQQKERGAAPNPDEGSTATGSKCARIPGPTACENTNDRCFVRDLHQPERFQMSPDANTDPAHPHK